MKNQLWYFGHLPYWADLPYGTYLQLVSTDFSHILTHSSLWMQISQWARVNPMHRYQWPYSFFPPPFSFLQGFLAPPPGWTFPGMPPWNHKHSAGGALDLAAPVLLYPPHPYFPHSGWRGAWTFLLDVRSSLGDVLLQSGGCARSLSHFQACSVKFLCVFWTHLVLILDYLSFGQSFGDC